MIYIKCKVFDVVDFRDFVLGAQNSGLVVRLPNNKVIRALYNLPYVSLRTRVSILPKYEIEFASFIWKLNKEFYTKINKDITVADICEEHRKLLIYVGFDYSSRIVDVCQWHIDRLKS